jgi:peptidoglycan/LPS O-acetylase OafA/YrhL
LFFFLSGFVLYLPYASGNRQLHTRSAVLDFYSRRFMRLMPLYFFIWVVSLVFMSGLQLNDRSFYFAVLAYVSVLYPFHPQTFYPAGNWVMWSIGLEIWFSVIFPVLVFMLSRWGWRRLLPVVLVGAFGVRLSGQLFSAAPEGQVLNFVSDSVLGRLDEFVLGMLAAHLYLTRRQLTAKWFPIGLLLIAGAALLWAGWYHQFISPLVTPIANNLLDTGIFLCALHLLFHESKVRRMLSTAWLQLMGMMCYSIYMWHGIVQLRFAASYKRGVVEYAAYVGVVMALSFFTYRYVEFRKTPSWRALLPQPEKQLIIPPKATIEAASRAEER